MGPVRLASACARALEFDACNYKTVVKILENGLDFTDESEAQDLPSHQNIWGNKYYK